MAKGPTPPRPTSKDIRRLVGEHMDDQHLRQPANGGRVEALDQLHAELVSHAREYAKGPLTQRQAVCDTIMSISEYLKAQGFSVQTLTPLHRVLTAIVDVTQSNQPDPLFAEKMRKAKGRRTKDADILTGHLAAMAKAGLKLSSSDEGDVSTKLKRLIRHLSGDYFGKVTAKRLSTARTYLNQSDKSDPLHLAFDQMEETLSRESSAAGGGERGLAAAWQAQLLSLNAKARLRRKT